MVSFQKGAATHGLVVLLSFYAQVRCNDNISREDANIIALSFSQSVPNAVWPWLLVLWENGPEHNLPVLMCAWIRLAVQ